MEHKTVCLELTILLRSHTCLIFHDYLWLILIFQDFERSLLLHGSYAQTTSNHQIKLFQYLSGCLSSESLKKTSNWARKHKFRTGTTSISTFPCFIWAYNVQLFVSLKRRYNWLFQHVLQLLFYSILIQILYKLVENVLSDTHNICRCAYNV